jgi:DNA-binding LacI/PurR family transcriptional regulator
LDFHLEMIKSLESRLSNAGKMLSINLTHTQPEKELRLLSTLLRNRLEALVYVTSPITASSPQLSREVKKWIDRYIQEGTYVIFADLSPIGLEQRLVSIDNVKAGQQLTEALIARGHKNIAFIGNPQHLSGQERYKGYSLAMRKAKLVLEPMHYLHCKMDDPGLEQCFREFRIQFPKVTGFVSDTQYSATCIKHVLECDANSRLSAGHCLASFFEAFVPPFDAVAWIHIPSHEIGDATSEILLRVRSANDKPHRIMIEPKIWQVID